MSDCEQVVFQSPWFKLVARPQAGGDPYYVVEPPDYVTVVALTSTRQLLLVRQFRPVVQRHTLELPSGHVEKNETPEQAARRELLEETGFVAPSLELLGSLVPDVGRLGNRMWCYFASDVRPSDGAHHREEGVTGLELPPREVLARAGDGTIDHALNLAALLLAVTAGKLRISE